jgi:hypothetical protein
VIAFGVIGGAHSSGPVSSTQTSTSTFRVTALHSELRTPEQDLLVAFMHPTVRGDGFDTMHMRIFAQDPSTPVLDVTFEGAADARDFFTGRTVSLGPTIAFGQSDELPIEIVMDVTSRQAGDGFFVDTIVGNSTLTPRAVALVTEHQAVVNARVGDAASGAIELANIAVAGSDNLNATFTGATGNVVGSGSVIGLAAGANDLSSLRVNVDTSASGLVNGTATIRTRSDGSATGLAQDFSDELVTVQGKIYAPAVAQLTSTIDFGTVRVGDVVKLQNIDVANVARGMFTDSLRETDRAVSGPFSVAALGSDIATGANAGLDTTLNTQLAGHFIGSAAFTYASHNQVMSDLALGTQTVGLTGTVNNLADAVFANVGVFGSLSGSGSSYVLDFGTLGSSNTGNVLSTQLAVRNAAMGAADNLKGTFVIDEAGVFTLTGFDPFANLLAGELLAGLTIDIATAGLGTGTYLGDLILNSFSTFAGLTDVTLDPITLAFRFSIVDDSTRSVSEPPVLALYVPGLIALIVIRRRKGGRRND